MFGLGVWVLLGAMGCDDDDGPPPPPPPTDSGPPMMDAGGDAGPPFDAGPRRDAEVVEDGGVPSCTVDPGNVYDLATDSQLGERVIGLAGGGSGFAVIWNETRAGFPDVFGRTFGPSGLDDEVQITSTTSRENAPTIVAQGTQWIAAWTDNDGTVGFDLRTHLLNADLSSAGARNDITDTSTLLEDDPVLGRISSGPIVAWVEDDMVAFTREARVRRLDADGAPNGAIGDASGSGRQPGRLALGEIDSGPVLFWSEREGSGQEVWMQRLNAAGARSGEPTAVTTSANGDGTVDVALDPLGGAAVFGVQVSGVLNEVRFRAISGVGMLTGDERVLTPGGGRDPSIALFAGGYAVSYRDTMSSPPRVVLLLVSAAGEVLDEVPVADAELGGGRTTVRVSGGGDIGVAWADDPGGSVNIRAALVRCSP